MRKLRSPRFLNFTRAPLAPFWLLRLLNIRRPVFISPLSFFFPAKKLMMRHIPQILPPCRICRVDKTTLWSSPLQPSTSTVSSCSVFPLALSLCWFFPLTSRSSHPYGVKTYTVVENLKNVLFQFAICRKKNFIGDILFRCRKVTLPSEGFFSDFQDTVT